MVLIKGQWNLGIDNCLHLHFGFSHGRGAKKKLISPFGKDEVMQCLVFTVA
jgi:hypothetical protein